jgi:hypothetical protein
MEALLCDYSLQMVKSRPAQVADKLVVHHFGHGTRGFAPIDDKETAVCVLPGTEIAFDKDVQSGWSYMFQEAKSFPKLARFRQICKDMPNTHHDMLEFDNGETCLLTAINEGQTATVLQLPAAPKTEAEAEEQRRAEFVG